MQGCIIMALNQQVALKQVNRLNAEAAGMWGKVTFLAALR